MNVKQSLTEHRMIVGALFALALVLFLGMTGASALQPPPEPWQELSGCDYSDAEQNNGWGWDAFRRQSCPPVEAPSFSFSSSSNQPIPFQQHLCVDSESPGGERDCGFFTTGERPAPGCDYRDANRNNGWGWNSRTGTSCPPLR